MHEPVMRSGAGVALPKELSWEDAASKDISLLPTVCAYKDYIRDHCFNMLYINCTAHVTYND